MDPSDALFKSCCAASPEGNADLLRGAMFHCITAIPQNQDESNAGLPCKPLGEEAEEVEKSQILKQPKIWKYIF